MKIPTTLNAPKLRAQQYWSTGDALGAIQKQLALMQEMGYPLHPEAEAWLDRCREIKERFPKKRKQKKKTA